MDTAKIESILQGATLLLKQYKRHIRSRDINTYSRCKAMNKSDIEFIEQFSLIHLKNIELQSKIPQGMKEAMDNYVFNNLFKHNVFSSRDMLRVILHRYGILPEKMLLDYVRAKLRFLLNDDLSKVKFIKNMPNALSILSPLPNTQKDIESFLDICKEILSMELLDYIVMNPLNLVFDTSVNKDEFIESMSANLKDICVLCGSTELLLDNTGEFFYEILESICNIESSVSNRIIAVSICSYELDSIQKLEKLASLSARFKEKRQIKLVARIKDLDVNYEIEKFNNSFNHRVNSVFTNEQSVKTNLLRLLDKCKEYEDIIDCILVTQDLFIIKSLEQIGLNARVEIDVKLNYPLFKILKDNITLIPTQCYTRDFTHTLAFRLKHAFVSLNHGLISMINCLNTKGEWDKLCSSFSKSYNKTSKQTSEGIQWDTQGTFNTKSFSYEIRRTLTGIDNKDEILANFSNMTFENLSDMGIYDLDSALNIISSIVTSLRDRANEAFFLLKHTREYMPDSIIEEQVYMLIDVFKYYAYEYKRLLEDSSSVSIVPLGSIFIHTENLAIHEIGSILASNIMIGNVSYMDSSLNARILYYLLESVQKEHRFFTIQSRENVYPNYEIIGQNDTGLYNTLMWRGGVHVVFISSFYDFHNAFLQIRNARYIHKEILIFTDSYIYERAREAFVPLSVNNSTLFNLIQNMPNNASSFSLFTFNKTEINYAINHINISICINGFYKSKLISGSARIFMPGLLQPFGSRLLMLNLLGAKPNNVLRKNSLYSDIIGCFNEILSIDELEFLYNLNHNYNTFLKNMKRVANYDNIYETKKPYTLMLRVYEGDDFFYVCVVMLIAFLFQLDSTISFNVGYFQDKEDMLEKLQGNLKEKYINNFTLVVHSDSEFAQKADSNMLVRILQEQSIFAKREIHQEILKKGIVTQYSLPTLSRSIELDKYLFTQYIQIEPNFLSQANLAQSYAN